MCVRGAGGCTLYFGLVGNTSCSVTASSVTRSFGGLTRERSSARAATSRLLRASLSRSRISSVRAAPTARGEDAVFNLTATIVIRAGVVFLTARSKGADEDGLVPRRAELAELLKADAIVLSKSAVVETA